MVKNILIPSYWISDPSQVLIFKLTSHRVCYTVQPSQMQLSQIKQVEIITNNNVLKRHPCRLYAAHMYKNLLCTPFMIVAYKLSFHIFFSLVLQFQFNRISLLVRFLLALTNEISCTFNVLCIFWMVTHCKLRGVGSFYSSFKQVPYIHHVMRRMEWDKELIHRQMIMLSFYKQNVLVHPQERLYC